MIKTSFLHSLGVLIYISLVAWIMTNAEKIFGKMNDWLGPVAFLLLFTLSALVVGGLILGKPIMLYLDGKKKDAVRLVIATAAWLAILTTITLIIVAVK